MASNTSISPTALLRRRRMALRFCVGVSLTTFLGACSGSLTDIPEPADLVLMGGRIVTVDAAGTEAEAVAVRSGEIVALGTSSEMRTFVGDGTEVVDLHGRLVIPGFIEGHGHFLGLGHALSILDLSTANSWSEIVEQVATAAAEVEPGQWIVGRGWHQEKWSKAPQVTVDDNPVHDALSAVTPDHPVMLRHASGHASIVNAKAMALSGVDRNTENPFGGEIVHAKNGAPTGLLRETAQRLVKTESAADAGGEDSRVRLVELAGVEALRNGVTSLHDAGVSFDDITFFRKMESEGTLPIRLYSMVLPSNNDELEKGLPDLKSVSEGDDFFVIRAIKRSVDGALGSHGAWLLEPYEDMGSSSGLNLVDIEEMRRTAALAAQYGFQFNTHAIGDRANREMLDIYGAAFGEHGGRDGDPNGEALRWRIEHAQHLHPDDVPRFAQLGVLASMQGVHCTSDAPWVFKRLGAGRAESGAYLWRALIDAGVRINNGTDVPVEKIDPIRNYYALVSRITGDGSVFFGDQKMTRMEALRSYTINNAYAAFEEDFKGSLEVGKLADMAVLSGDILSLPVEQLPEVLVDLTVLAGDIVYRRE